MYSIDNNRLAKQISDLSNTDHSDSGRDAAAGFEFGQEPGEDDFLFRQRETDRHRGPILHHRQQELSSHGGAG